MKGILVVVAALALGLSLFSSSPVEAVDTNNFRISNYDIQYELSRDSEGRSVLKTKETITAEFPNYDQNHGIERAIPLSYDGHSTSLDTPVVTDASGRLLSVSERTENNTRILRIGDPNTYVQGTQTYVLEYTQRDVTRFYQDTNRDEWYWDTNGTEWRVPINQLTVSVTIDPVVSGSLETAPQCYIGAAGEAGRCVISSLGKDSYQAKARNLAVGENITLSFGFTKGTFAQYEQPLWMTLLAWWLLLAIITGVLGFILVIILSIAYARRRNRTKELTTIVTEYIPPKDTSVTISAQVVSTRGSSFVAQLIDLAVRHYIQIIETKPKSTWGLAEYDIKVIKDPSTLLPEELELLSDMFGSVPAVGSTMSMKSLRDNYSYTSRLFDNSKKIKTLLEGSYAMRAKDGLQSKYFYRWSIALLIFGLLTLSPALLVFSGIVAILGSTLRPLTDRGLALRRYLLGLDRYIAAAETERLKMFQGPDTAQKVGEAVDPNNTQQLLKLYERVLPYAILFGREKEWSKRLGEFYATTQTAPDWYAGSAAFNGAMFGTMVSSFSTSTTYSSGSSSSSGGSSGGGSSGGGGGGGGGGGW